jgi:hypothetical protein
MLAVALAKAGTLISNFTLSRGWYLRYIYVLVVGGVDDEAAHTRCYGLRDSPAYTCG